MPQIQVTIDPDSGFCFGVKRAIEQAGEILEKEGELYCLGEIVHNRPEVERLEGLGLIGIDHARLPDLKGKKLLFRAHGEPPESYLTAEKNNIKLTDATCPIVKKLQERIKKAAERDEPGKVQIVIFGNPGHPETIGLLGQAQESAIVVSDPSETTAINPKIPVELFAQTTKSPAGFKELAENIRLMMSPHFAGSEVPLKINNTICRQISLRGPLIREFAGKFDMIVFVGGRESSNAKVLFSNCLEVNSKSRFVSGPEELRAEWFKGASTAGVCGATSTPRWLMEKVAAEIKEIAGSGITGSAVAGSGPTESGPTGSGPTGSGPTESEPTGSGPTESEPTESGPTGSGPTESGPTESGPTESGPTESGPTESEPTESEPAESGPTGSEPAESGPTGSEPTGSEDAGYADLILPLPLPGVFTYSVPEPLRRLVSPGKRVTVQFGRKRNYTAIVSRTHNIKPKGYETKEIIAVPDHHPVVLPVQLRFWEWIASYYMCSAGEVLKAAVPSAIRPGIEGQSGIKPKTESYLSLHPSVCSEEKVTLLPGQLKRAPGQLGILLRYLNIGSYSGNTTPAPEVPKRLLMENYKGSSTFIRALIDKKILTETLRQVSRITGPEYAQKEISMLNRYQEDALAGIKDQFRTKEVVLLNGITSGGKTEVYIHLVREQLRKGKQVLYLLPEIALTAQIIVRLKNIFGEQAGIYHSGFSDAERAEIWNRVLNNNEDSYRLILGARSSLFLPFSELGLIIVDEEHENSFKQADPAPRYHARDAAIMLASMHGAKTLLGTATPSVESYFNALSGKHGLVNLTKRFKEMELPEIVIADTREARKKRKMKSLFTPQLLDAVEVTLAKGEQVILFQNRRGYAPFTECSECGWIPHCNHCDVSMTYHKTVNRLICHYCGDSRKPPGECPECSSSDLKTRGFGTEKIEDEISLFFPDSRVGRLDLDSVRKKRSHEKIIGLFETGRLDILAGTQMIAKGLDFGRVSLVGILNADNLLFFPDFRAHERSFQLIAQVSGRAGRGVAGGRVVIQTGFPGHPVIRNILSGDFEKHFREMLAERRQFLYPPYVRLVRIRIKQEKREFVEQASSALAAGLRKRFGNRVLGPEYPPVSRIQKLYVMEILLKLEKKLSLPAAKESIRNEIAAVNSRPQFRSCTITPDVDPY